MVRHPSTGLNVLMAGIDLLDGGLRYHNGQKQDKEYCVSKKA
jgi:hypothetical protein